MAPWDIFGSSYPRVTPSQVDGEEFDYIIVGGGTAGCVLASRLSEDPNLKILVLERGQSNNDDWISRNPVASADPRRGGPSTLIVSQPMKHCNNRAIRMYVGNGLGGTSQINTLLYTRGFAADYDNWAAMGHKGWAYCDLLPYFVKSERSLSYPSSKHRGSVGLWMNRKAKLQFKVVEAAIEAENIAGIPLYENDMHHPEAPSVGNFTLDATVSDRGERQSANRAFLPARVARDRRQRLKICINTIAGKLEFETEGEKLRVTGVHFRSGTSKTDKCFYAKARKEVVVCSGWLGSPQLLMLSGIGPREHLEKHGIKVVRDMPGVGSELSDHISVASMAKISQRDSMHRLFNIRYALLEALKYIFLKRGQLTQPFTTVAAYLHSDRVSDEGKIFRRPEHEKEPTVEPPSEIIPDLEIIPIPAQGNDDLEVSPGIGVFTWMVLLNKPKSRGTVRLASANPLDYPLVDLNFFGDPHDLLIARKGVRLTMNLFADMRKQGYQFKEWLCPVPDCDNARLDESIRANTRAGLHQASTCRMAPESNASPGVVDDELRVHGTLNLRICDASIFPEIVSAHTMAPSVMVAEKCADMIKNSA